MKTELEWLGVGYYNADFHPPPPPRLFKGWAYFEEAKELVCTYIQYSNLLEKLNADIFPYTGGCSGARLNIGEGALNPPPPRSHH